MQIVEPSSEVAGSLSAAIAHEIHLAERPKGWPTAESFEYASVELPLLADDEVLVRNLFMSVDPSMRGRMNEGPSYVPPYQIGKPLEGRAIGSVVESRAPEFRIGDTVQSRYGWRDYFVAPATELDIVDSKVQPLSAHLGVLGMPGLTAWVGLNLVDVKVGDRVFVSGAAGAVGSIAGQLAKLRGCFVVGSAGSDDKARTIVQEFGFDAAFNYKHGQLSGQLATAAPDGIDVYFDNVGGDHLEAALGCMRDYGRIAACGAIASYNDEGPSPGPRNFFAVVTRRLMVRGFIGSDHVRDMNRFVSEVSPLVTSGKLKAVETIVQGLENAPQALLDLLRGRNIGKMIVKLA